jgi:phosphoribosylformimino-5-aminoimidazole carboxamide ribotide isomerase
MSESTFVVYPAIDLRQGKVVRLVQGDPAQQTTYSQDPAAIARRWLEAGARWLHVINLDGAFGEDGQENRAALLAIVKIAAAFDPSTRVQFGGGLHSLDDVAWALEAGAGRVVLGSLAIEAPELVSAALARFGVDRIALAVDVRDSSVRTRGWLQDAHLDPAELGRRFYSQGLRYCIYTAIRRDGGGEGLDLLVTQQFARASRLSVVASGGAASLEDVRGARQAGLSGVILGKALYEGKIDLQKALQC